MVDRGPEVGGIETPSAGEGALNAFQKRVALSTAILAVILAIASLGGTNATKEMLLAQQQASDQWAFYQAKVIREHLYRSQADALASSLALHPDRGRGAEAEKLVAFRREAQRYAQEKAEIKTEAERLEKRRDLAGKRDENFDFAEVLLQIAVVISSVSILASSKLLYLVALLFGAGGSLLTINGYLLLVPLF